jgi:hypothetical protein
LKFKNFIDDDKFSQKINTPEGMKIFQELWIRVMGSKEPKMTYEDLVNHDNFFDLIKTEEGRALFKEFEGKYKLNKREKSNFNQTRILENISTYIENSNPALSKDEKEYLSLLKEDLKEGHCSGFSYLYLVAKMEGKEDVFFEKLQIISQWNGKSKLTPEEALVFEELTGQLIVAQDKFIAGGHRKIQDKQSNPNRISKLLSPDLLIDHEPWIMAYDIDSVKNNLSSLSDGAIVELAFFPTNSSKGHSVAISKKNGKYYYYDSNNILGEIELDSVEKLSSKILKSAESVGYDQNSLKFLLTNYVTNPDEVIKKSKKSLSELVYQSEELVNTGLSVRSKDIKKMLDLFDNIRPKTRQDINEFESLAKKILLTFDLDLNQRKEFSEHYLKVIMSTGDTKRINDALLFIDKNEGLKPERIGTLWRSYFNNVHRKAKLEPYEERLAFNILCSITSILLNKKNLTEKERADLKKELQDFLKNHPKSVYLKEELIKSFEDESKSIKEIEKLFSTQKPAAGSHLNLKNESIDVEGKKNYENIANAIINFSYTHKKEENFGNVLKKILNEKNIEEKNNKNKKENRKKY